MGNLHSNWLTVGHLLSAVAACFVLSACQSSSETQALLGPEPEWKADAQGVLVDPAAREAVLRDVSARLGSIAEDTWAHWRGALEHGAFSTADGGESALLASGAER